MEKRIIITEEERSRISNLHLLNEGILGKLMNRIKNSKIYKKVEKAYDPNPQTFVQNIIKEMPKLEKVKDQLNQKISEISKMSDEEKQKYLEKNNVDLERGIKDIDVKLNEQKPLPSGPPPVGIPYGPIFMVLLVIGLIYILIGIHSTMKLKREDPEKYNELKGGLNTKDTKIDRNLQSLVDRTINLYEDETQRDLWATGKITSLHVGKSNILSGDIQNIYMNLRITTKGVSKKFEVYFKVYCQYNPSKLEDRITVKRSDVSRIGDGVDYLYNKQFTNRLNDIVGNDWCVRPDADFGSVDKSDNSNLA